MKYSLLKTTSYNLFQVLAMAALFSGCFDNHVQPKERPNTETNSKKKPTPLEENKNKDNHSSDNHSSNDTQIVSEIKNTHENNDSSHGELPSHNSSPSSENNTTLPATQIPSNNSTSNATSTDNANANANNNTTSSGTSSSDPAAAPPSNSVGTPAHSSASSTTSATATAQPNNTPSTSTNSSVNTTVAINGGDSISISLPAAEPLLTYKTYDHMPSTEILEVLESAGESEQEFLVSPPDVYPVLIKIERPHYWTGLFRAPDITFIAYSDKNNINKKYTDEAASRACKSLGYVGFSRYLWKNLEAPLTINLIPTSTQVETLIDLTSSSFNTETPVSGPSYFTSITCIKKDK